MNDVLTAIENLPDGESVNEAYNQLMPQDQLGLPDVIRRIMGTHNDGIMEHTDNRRRAGQYTMLQSSRYLLADSAGSIALLSETGEWMPFVKGIGLWADRDDDRDIAGYKYKVYGAIGGIDKKVSDDSIMGFSIGGLRTNVDYTRGSTEADIDSLLLALHGSYFGDDWHLDYTAGYGRSWYDQQRGIAFLNRTAKSDHTSNAYTIELEYGQNLGGYNSILEPFAGVGYTLIQENGYTEKNAGAANLKVDSEDYDGFYTKLGIQTTTEVTFENNPDVVMVPKLSAVWVHDFADRVEVSSSFVGGGSFSTEGLDPVRDMINVGAGLNTYINDNTRIFVDYVWQFSSDFESHMLQAGIQWPF
jgi:outer membrane autotransporter protein